MSECASLGLDRPECCEDGLAIKFGGKQNFPQILNIIFWMLFLFWCFLGVAIVADIFMSAIEKVTSKKKRKLNPKTQRFVTVLVWNPTVANLTLMALGSSAPEILLNVIGIIKDGFIVEPLGPATIVGSAAFNLLMILSVCVMAIPKGEVRAIKEVPVYVCTAIFSVFAYIWLLFILTVTSEKEVEVWEALLTFLFFPILVTISYMLDVGMIPGIAKPQMGQEKVISADMSMEELAEMEAKIRQEHGAHLTEDQVAKIISIEAAPPTSRAAYRVAATRKMTGSKKVETTGDGRTVEMRMGSFCEKNDIGKKDQEADATPKAIIQFLSTKYVALESAGEVKIKVRRSGLESNRVTVDYKTRDGAAQAGDDFVHKEGQLVFEPGETEQTITIEIMNDDAYEDDEEFFVDLLSPTDAELGPHGTTMVTIIDDDMPGIIGFPHDEVHITDKPEAQQVPVVVTRKSGSAGKISCQYHTENATAVGGVDFEKTEGTLEFEDGMMRKEIVLTIMPSRGRYDTSEMFRLVLDGDITGGGKFDPASDGGDDSCILTVFIESDAHGKERIDRLNSTLKVRWDKAKVGHSNWADQFKEALSVGGGDDEVDDDGNPVKPGPADYVLHFLSLPWKLIFAVCPPTDFCDGWLCFFCSLFFVGGVTVIVGDGAERLGCVMGIPDLITAITFVALGTSLPDTFASKTAAEQDPYADAAIVNVTGSNSVNVFLGLGMPWTIGALYWVMESKNMPVGADGLDFSVIIFTICAILCITTLAVRRAVFGGELGGPQGPKIGTSIFLAFLWVFYILMSIWNTLKDS